MAVSKTLAYYFTGTITAVKGFIVQAPSIKPRVTTLRLRTTITMTLALTKLRKTILRRTTYTVCHTVQNHSA
jgi:hypothetical protein